MNAIGKIMAAFSGAAGAVMLTGCALGTTVMSGAVAGGNSAAASFAGTVMGGQQPVSGATIQLYAAGMPMMPASGGSTGGYGLGAVALISSGTMTAGSTNNYFVGGAPGCVIPANGVNANGCTALPQTNASGSFTITGDYTCTSDSQVYIVATGGNPGLASTVNNGYIAMTAGLGSCAAGGTLSSALTINIDEVTTVATVWALQQFMQAPTGTAASGYASQGGAAAGVAVGIGAPSGPAGGYGASGVQTSVSGLKNGFAMINNLTNISTGSSGTGSAGMALNSFATPWAAKINTIADILAACINTDSTSDGTCASLMTNATPAGSTAALDTIQAAWYMAQNPTNNVGALFGLVSGTPPFSALSTVPNDWGIFVGLAPTFSGGANAVSSPFDGSVDEYGHVWLTNLNPAGTGPFISEIGGDGTPLAGPFNTYTASGGFTSTCSTTATHTLTGGSTGSKAIAIDLSNVVWVNNPNEAACTGSIFTVMRINGSTGYSPTSGGWVAPSVTNGYFESSSTYAGIAVDANNNVYLSNSGSSGKLQQFAPGGAYTAGAALGASSPSAIVIDNSAKGSGPYIWTVGSKDCTSPQGQVFQQPLSALTTTASVQTYQNSTCTSGTFGSSGTVVNVAATMALPYGAAADRNNNLWSTNSAANTVNWFVPNAGGVLDTTAATTVTSAAALGGIAIPYGVAVDGNNVAWVASSGSAQPYYVAALQGANTATPSIGLAPQLQGAGSAGLGFAFTSSSNPFLHSPRGVAIDPSGNVWFFNNSTTSNYTWVSVLVGQAAPVITPLALQLKAGMIGQKP